MLSTYFRYKSRKLVSFLFVLQLSVILVLIGYYQTQIHSEQQERQIFVDLFNTQPQWEAISINNNTSAVLDWMYDMVEIESRNLAFLNAALKLRKLTNIRIAEIEAMAISKDIEKKNSKSDDLVADYYDFAWRFSEETILDTADRRVFKETYTSRFSITGNFLLKQQYEDLKDKGTYQAFFEKTKRDIRFIENLWIKHIGWKMRDRCLSFPYKLQIEAANRFWEGDTLHLKATFVERIFGKRKAVIEKDTLSTDEYGIARYRRKTTKIGRHQLEGQILKTDGWGRTIIYPFTHEYTVLPKCN